jgi:hypothetical protein
VGDFAIVFSMLADGGWILDMPAGVGEPSASFLLSAGEQLIKAYSAIAREPSP